MIETMMSGIRNLFESSESGLVDPTGSMTPPSFELELLGFGPIDATGELRRLEVDVGEVGELSGETKIGVGVGPVRVDGTVD